MTADVLIITNRVQRRAILLAGLHSLGYTTLYVETLDEALHYIGDDPEPGIMAIDRPYDPVVLREFIATVREKSQINIITVGYDVAYENGCLHLPRRAPVDVVIQSVETHLTL
jgi:hypothetical protein